MKKILYILCAVFALASCQKTELPTTGGQNPDGTYTFNIGIEEPDYAPQSRAAVTMGRYVMEMYEGDLTATPIKNSNSTGVFNVELKKNTDYVCLFWADNGSEAYDATNLQAVKQANETKLGTAAYFAKVTVNSKTFNGAVTLKRAVAELSFIDKNGLTEATNTLKITYPYTSATFNLGDGTVAHATGSAVRTITNIAPPADKATAFTTDYLLAPTEAGKIAGLKFQLNAEEEKTIDQTAIKANVKTKITGEYQPKPIPAAVGDFYMKNDTWLPGTTTLTAAQKADCIGIVYIVNPNGTTGQIVGLTEATDKKWGAFRRESGANNSHIDGATATKKLITARMGDSNFATAYSAFEWVYTTANSSDLDGRWYLPAKDELLALYAVWNGDAMPTANDTARSAFNTQLTTAGGTKISDSSWYWSSTQNADNGAWYVSFGNGGAGSDGKDLDNRVRVVSAF